MAQKQTYLDFDDYIRQGEPSQRERAEAWRVAIGLQAFLERFFRNLLLGEQWDLRNRYLHIHPTEEWSVQPNLDNPTSTPVTTCTATRTSTRISSSVTRLNPGGKIYTSNDNIIELVRVIAYEELSIKQMMDIKGLKHRNNFIEYHLEPALKEKFVRRKYPDRPNHPRQKYLLTVKGQALYNELKKERI